MIKLSIKKLEEGIVNEDAVISSTERIAVSDGAGGGGVFADRWARYLVNHLPAEPICNYQAFDTWLDGIWETFYNECEDMAKTEGGMLLNKFYDEGSFATLVAVWNTGEWISYGDSVAFCYDKTTGKLSHSFGKIVEFNNPPFLINCKDATSEIGFRHGKFETSDSSIIFAASDTLAHYILMMYEVANKDKFTDELQEAINAKTKDSNFINAAMTLDHIDFLNDVLQKLLNCRNDQAFTMLLKSLLCKRLIGHDDYSFVAM